MGGSINTLNFQMGSESFLLPELNSNMTVYTLKSKILAYSGVFIKYQTLSYKNTVLDDRRTLSSYGIKEGETIVVDEKAKVAAEVLYIESKQGTKLACVEFNPNKTVSNVKQMIQEKTETPSTRQKLYFKGTNLVDEKTLAMCNIVEGSILQLEITPLNKQMIMVEMPEHPVIELKFNPNQTVENLKHALFAKIKIPSDELRLFFNESHLEEKKTLANYAIIAGSVLRLTRRPKLELLLYIVAPTSTQSMQDFKPINTVHDIKAKIHQESNVPIKEQRLEFEGKELEDKNNLAYYNMQDGAKIKLTYKVVPEISVKFKDKNFSLTFNPDCTVLDFKAILLEKTEVPVEQQQLIYAGKVLENDKKLSDYNIQKDNGITLVWQLPKQDKIQIMIENHSLKTVTISISPETRILVVKSVIAKDFDTLPGNQILKFNEVPLVDDQTLNYYKVKNDSRLLFETKPNGIRDRAITLPSSSMPDPVRLIPFEMNLLPMEPQEFPQPSEPSEPQESPESSEPSEDASQYVPVFEPEVPCTSPPPYNRDAGLAQYPIDSGTVLLSTHRRPVGLPSADSGYCNVPEFVLPIIINIKVSVLCSNNFDLMIGKNETILAVKTKLEEIKEFDKQTQRIFFNKKLCENDSTLSQLGILENCAIEVDIPQVWRLAHNAQQYEVECYSHATIAKFKEEIKRKINMATQLQHLFSIGTELIDTETLHHYRLRPQEPISLLTFVSVKIQFSNGKSSLIPNCELDKTTGKLLKDKICKQDGIPVNFVRLTYRGKEVVDSQTLEAIKYEVNKHIIADIDVEKSKEMSLLIRLPTGKIQLIRMHTLDTVGRIKNVVDPHSGVSNTNCNCQFKDEMLRDEDVLQSYDIRELSEIELIPNSTTVVNLTLMNGKSKCFSLKLFDSVEETVRRIISEFYLPVEHNRLFYGRDKLIYFTQNRISNGEEIFIGTENSFIITVQPEFSRPVKFLVSNEETVSALKYKIEQKEKFPIDLQCLTFSGSQMLDEHLIGKYNLLEHSFVILKLSGLHLISITVTDQCNNSLPLPNVNPYSKVSELNSQILTHFEIVGRCRFVFQSTLLPGLSPLCAYNIKNESCLMFLTDKKDCLRKHCEQQQQQQHPPPMPHQPQLDPKRVFEKTISFNPESVKPRTRTCYGTPPVQNYCGNCRYSVCICTQYKHGNEFHPNFQIPSHPDPGFFQRLNAYNIPGENRPNSIPNTPTGFGQTNAPTGFGQANAPTGFGQTNASTGFGQANAPTGFGQTNASTGSGQTNAPTGFGQTNAPTGFGQANVPTGFGQTNTSTGSGQTNAPTGFGQTNAPTGFGQTNTPTGFGQTNTPTGFGQTNAPTGFGQNNAFQYNAKVATPGAGPSHNNLPQQSFPLHSPQTTNTPESGPSAGPRIPTSKIFPSTHGVNKKSLPNDFVDFPPQSHSGHTPGQDLNQPGIRPQCLSPILHPPNPYSPQHQHPQQQQQQQQHQQQHPHQPTFDDTTGLDIQFGSLHFAEQEKRPFN